MAKQTRNTTAFGKASIKEFSKYITPDNLCYETSFNRSDCIDTIKCEYEGRITKCDSSKVQNEAYCALSLFVILQRAANELGLDVKKLAPLKTKGALDFLNKSKKAGVFINNIALNGVRHP